LTIGARNWLPAIRFAVGVAIVATSGGVLAGALDRLYVGGSIGATSASATDTNDTRCDFEFDHRGGADTAFGVEAGYRFLPYLAAEFAYLNGGQPEWRQRFVYVAGLDGSYNSYAKVDIAAAELSAVGILPFARIWEAYLRVGVAHYGADAHQMLVSRFDGTAVTQTFSRNATVFLRGLGIGMAPTQHVSLRVELQSFPIDEKVLRAHGNAVVDTVLIEIQYHFRGADAR